ncbi:MAG: hypothetical protein ACLQQ4_14765 [Bacteroidia bacterium]
MKKLLFIAFVSGIALVACKGGNQSADAEKAKQDSIMAKNHQDSLMNVAKMQHQKDSIAAMPKDTTKADTTKKK